jgi:hypothetical protein
MTDLPAPLWRPIIGWPYEISPDGRVRSVDRIRRDGRRHKGRVLRTQILRAGYRYAYLCKDRRERNVAVHILVLTAFVGPRPKGMVCRHLDGDRLNNRVENLCWGTPEENSDDMDRHGTRVRGSRHFFAKLSEADAVAIFKRMAAGANGPSLAREYGVTHRIIYCIKNRILWRHATEGL